MTILVVEDEQIILKTILKKMELKDVTGVGVENGQKAFEYLNNEDNQLPDLIWLDYHLPDMNGIKFMDMLRQDDRIKDIPVIVVSNSANNETMKDMMLLGIKDYYVKAEQKLDDLIEGALELTNN